MTYCEYSFHWFRLFLRFRLIDSCYFISELLIFLFKWSFEWVSYRVSKNQTKFDKLSISLGRDVTRVPEITTRPLWCKFTHVVISYTPCSNVYIIPKLTFQGTQYSLRYSGYFVSNDICFTKYASCYQHHVVKYDLKMYINLFKRTNLSSVIIKRTI